MNMIESRARFETVIQYRTYLNLMTLAHSQRDWQFSIKLRESALEHRNFAKMCTWIVTGRFS